LVLSSPTLMMHGHMNLIHVVRGLLKEENTQATPILAHYTSTKSDYHTTDYAIL
jgi:sensor histidine kinase regulating citrate/malate metabolism